jgi:hypothetical protein
MIALLESRRQQLDNQLPITCDIYLFVTRRPQEPLISYLPGGRKSFVEIAVPILPSLLARSVYSNSDNNSGSVKFRNRTPGCVATKRRMHHCCHTGAAEPSVTDILVI